MSVLARAAFELASTACHNLVSFRRQEPSARHIVQRVVV